MCQLHLPYMRHLFAVKEVHVQTLTLWSCTTRHHKASTAIAELDKRALAGKSKSKGYSSISKKQQHIVYPCDAKIDRDTIIQQKASDVTKGAAATQME